MKSEETALPAFLIDESTELTLAEFSRICAVEERRIVEFVDEGVLTVIEVEAAVWRFSGADLRRARLAVRLHRDLELNMAGLALALDLMDEIERLRHELQARR